jgi:potassium channel subfamily K
MVVTVIGAYQGHYDKEFKLTMSQRTLMLQTISFLVYLELGATVFGHIEQWNFLDALYWADFTLLTVGIGDYAPATHLGRSLLFPFAIGGQSYMI